MAILTAGDGVSIVGLSEGVGHQMRMIQPLRQLNCAVLSLARSASRLALQAAEAWTLCSDGHHNPDPNQAPSLLYIYFDTAMRFTVIRTRNRTPRVPSRRLTAGRAVHGSRYARGEEFQGPT